MGDVCNMRLRVYQFVIGLVVVLFFSACSGITDGTGDLSTSPQLISGGYHSCALSVRGDLTCWGNNDNGQIGDGASGLGVIALVPSAVQGVPNSAIDIAAGQSHSCALLRLGQIRCWGWNALGQLGNRTTTSATSAVDVVGLGGEAIQIAAGGSHNCTVLRSGAVECWGNGNNGQLGHSLITSSSVPVAVVGSGVSTQVSCGQSHSCAIDANGVKCWGSNDRGQLGLGSIGGYQNSAQAVVGLSGLTLTQVSAGRRHTCVLTSAGAVYCWGANDYLQLGSQAASSVGTPALVASLSSGVASIRAGGEHSCALLSTGGVKCWGRKDLGQIGDSTATSRVTSTPTDVTGLTADVVSMTAGWSHTCARKSDQTVWCWGDNRNAQLGDSTLIPRYAPVRVRGY